MRARYYAEVVVVQRNSHTGDTRVIPIHIQIDGQNSADLTQKASDIGKQLGILLAGPL